jgi:hypothetical protein
VSRRHRSRPWAGLGIQRWAGIGALLLAAAGPANAAGPASGDPPAGDAQRGRIVYLTGRLTDGTPLAARRPGAGALPPAAAACVACHRPSAMGGTEGGVLVPPIAGPRLFSAGQPPAAAALLQRQWLRHQTRSAYTPALLARALGRGLDADGRALSTAMPRYTLDAQTLADLSAFLRQRGSTPPPGVDDQQLHLATVVTPQAPAERRTAVLQAMQAWSSDLRLGARRVVWHRWSLAGPPATWPAQLDALWAAQPVYALLSGAGGDDWAPVQALCETRGLPCLMPALDQPPPDPGDQRHWSLYLHGGPAAEARLLAQQLRDLPQTPLRVRQVHTSAAGAAAADALRQALSDRPAIVVEDAAPLSMPAATGDDTLTVLWLPPDALAAWFAAHPAPAPASAPGAQAPRLVLSAQLAPPLATPVPPSWRPLVWWVSLRADPVRRAAGAALSLVPWQQRLGLPADLDAATLDDVHAATFFFADAMAQLRGAVDTEQLLETLEVAVDRRPAGAGYARLSLGPGQRIAAQSGQVLAFQPPRFEVLVPLGPLLRADD